MGILPEGDRQILLLPTEEIQPNPMQPRRIFDEESLRELASSVEQHGILQPLTVRKTWQGWELIAGERRLRAAKLAGLPAVPCLVTEVDDDESALLALVENLQREDLHYLEQANAIAAFLRRTGLTQEQAAAKLGHSPSALANKLRLLRLSPACAELLLRHGLSERHARCLLRLEEDSERLAALRYIAAHHLTVAQAEQHVERRLQALQVTPPEGRRTFIIKDVRLFLNSVDRGLRLIRDAGINAQSGREETEDDILLTIRIPKQGRREIPAKRA